MVERTARRRLFAPQLPVDGGALQLPADSAHHARVLRLGVGAELELFDGRGGQAEAVLTEVSRHALRCQAQARREAPYPRPSLHLLLGLPKAGKLEPIVRMLTELGVSSLRLVSCERSVARPDSRDAPQRLDRLNRVALEACAQSGQPRAPDLHPPAPLLEAALLAPPDQARFVFWERAERPLAAVALDPTATQLWAVVGPEGGLSDIEVTALTGAGFAVVGLGPMLLRVETAAPVISALLLDRAGRFGSRPAL